MLLKTTSNSWYILGILCILTINICGPVLDSVWLAQTKSTKAGSPDCTASANTLRGVFLALGLILCHQVLCRYLMVKLRLQTHGSSRRSSQPLISMAMNCSVVLRSQPLLLVLQSVSSCTLYVINLWPFQPATETWMFSERVHPLSLTSVVLLRRWQRQAQWQQEQSRCRWLGSIPRSCAMVLLYDTGIWLQSKSCLSSNCIERVTLELLKLHIDRRRKDSVYIVLHLGYLWSPWSLSPLTPC